MKSSRRLAALAAAASMVLTSCGGGSGGDDSTPPPGPPGGAESKSILFPTDGTLNYLSGYDSGSGKVFTTACMKPVSDILKDTSANPYANVYTYQMKMVESKSELYDFLQASYQTEVKYVIGKNQTAVDMSNQFRHESESIYVLVKSTWDGPVFTAKDPAFEGSGADFLAKYATYQKFVENCGDSFVLSLQAGMQFYGMFKLTYSSTSERNQVRASLYNKTLTAKTSKEFNNVVGFNSATTSVEVTARIIGGTKDGPDTTAPKISDVRTVDQFFDYVSAYDDTVKQAIKDGHADGLQTPSPALLYGYAVHAVVVPYKQYLIKQFNLSSDWFVADTLGSNWADLAPLTGLYAAQIDAYNQLDHMVRNPWLFASTASPGKSLTDQEITQLRAYRDRFKASASPEDSTRGLQVLILLCDANPDTDKVLVRTGGGTYSDVAKSSNATPRNYCRNLYAGGKDDASGCEGPAFCAAIYDKLEAADERDRLPFFTFDTVASDDSGQPVAIVDENQDEVLRLPALMTNVPRDCAALKNASPNTLADGDYTVYFMGRTDQPYTVYCQGMDTAAPGTYLTLDPAYVNERIVNDVQVPVYNFSMRGNGDSRGNLVASAYRTWQKYRLVSTADGVAIDLGDLAYSWRYNPQSLSWWSIEGAFVSFNVNLGPPARSNLDLTGTGLALRKDNIMSVGGWGTLKPYVQFHSYLDAANKPYIQGVTAFMPGNNGEMRMNNPGAATSIWLEYVPDVANTNKGAGILSGNKVVPVTQQDGSSWCNGWGPTCAPAFLTSILDLYNAK